MCGIPDFSQVGYKYGDEDVPQHASGPTSSSTVTVPSPHVDLVTARLATSNDAVLIQDAIDMVSALTADPTTGIRGVVLLGRGAFRIDTTLRIDASGVILRGAGHEAFGFETGASGTVLYGTATTGCSVSNKCTLIKVGGIAPQTSTPQKSYTTSLLNDVAVSAYSVNISSLSASHFDVGDLVTVERIPNGESPPPGQGH